MEGRKKSLSGAQLENWKKYGFFNLLGHRSYIRSSILSDWGADTRRMDLCVSVFVSNIRGEMNFLLDARKV